MPTATWNGALLAQADAKDVQHVEGNVYFPRSAIDKRFFRDSNTHTVCPWKGTCSYYDVVVEGSVNKDAAWFYPVCKPEARHIEGFVAFWKGVEVA